MRGFAHFVLMGLVAAVCLWEVSTTAAQAPARDAAGVLADARQALGGEKRLSAIKNFVATGRTRQVRGDNLVPIEFEIAVELPDKYVRKDEIPAQESGPTSTGFNGAELIQLPVPVAPMPPPGGRAGAPPPTPAQIEAGRNARVIGVKQDFVRLTLGMFAASFASYPLTFTYVGQAEAPQGRADVIEAKGSPNFTARLFVNSETHLPIMVSWQAPGRPTPPAGGPGRQAAAGPSGAPGAAPPAQSGAAAGPRPAAPAPATGGERGGTPASAAGVPATGSGPVGAPPAARQGAPGAGPSPGPPQGGTPGMGRGGPPAAPVEFRIYYADYRDVDGVQWPFRLRRASGPDTTEETTFDRFKINTKIDPKKFEVRK